MEKFYITKICSKTNSEILIVESNGTVLNYFNIAGFLKIHIKQRERICLKDMMLAFKVFTAL